MIILTDYTQIETYLKNKNYSQTEINDIFNIVMNDRMNDKSNNITKN